MDEFFFCGDVHCTEAVIEKNNFSVEAHASRNAQPLSLSAAQVHPAFANFCVESVAHGCKIWGKGAVLQKFESVGVVVWLGAIIERHIVTHGGTQDESILRDESKKLPERGERECESIVTIDVIRLELALNFPQQCIEQKSFS